MAVKPRFNAEAEAKANERFDKLIARIYIIWLVGILIGAIELKPEKFEYGGVSFVIEHADKLQGIAFVVCVVFYIGLMGIALLYQTQHLTTDRAIKRRILYSALDGRKTLVGRERRAVQLYKFKARLLYWMAVLFVLFTATLPLIHIVFFQQAAFLSGLDAIFHSSSVENGQIKLLAPVTLLLTLAIMVFWTMLVHWFAVKCLRLPPGSDRTVFVNMVAVATFAFLDSKFRGQQTFSEAFFRDLGLQVTILLLYMVPRLIALPFLIWFKVVGALYSWLNKKKSGK